MQVAGTIVNFSEFKQRLATMPSEVFERAADGIWYRASNVELRGKGVLATWSVEGRQPTECRAVD